MTNLKNSLMTETNHECPRIDTNFCRNQKPRRSTVLEYRSNAVTLSPSHFKSASVPQRPSLRRKAPPTPALFPRSRAAQAVQTQLPRVRLRLQPVSYFS